ncbi:hypothetical protein [Salsipaludibacter albus]|uniref:hypothetical protein n=1 Tax=Salsipaludibacter albus TaxID=2849650 RepID=UPI001EE497CC|nr:hypothetical protein [Salsipaludibacter albus]MBY5162931.1 hypothetical protein [Salsipaludibacter albus]
MYWYCLHHSRVEHEDEGCADRRRLGPFETREEAAAALDTVADRNEEWENDPAWNDDEDGQPA